MKLRSTPLRGLTLIGVLALTACARQPPKPEFIVPAGAEMASDMFGYSQAVRVGHWITVSAQVGIDPKTQNFPDDFKRQVQLAFQNLQTVLKAAGASLNDVVSITTYQLDMDKFQDVVDVHNAVFDDHHPAWTAIGVKALPFPTIQFEVSAMAWTAASRGPAAGSSGAGG